MTLITVKIKTACARSPAHYTQRHARILSICTSSRLQYSLILLLCTTVGGCIAEITCQCSHPPSRQRVASASASQRTFDRSRWPKSWRRSRLEAPRRSLCTQLVCAPSSGEPFGPNPSGHSLVERMGAVFGRSARSKPSQADHRPPDLNPPNVKFKQVR